MMTDHLLEIVSSLPPSLLVPLGARFAQSFGLPYEAELHFEVLEHGGLSDDMLEELLQQPAALRFGLDGDLEVHGIFRGIVMESTHDPERIRYRAWLVPRLWELSQIRRSRIFQDASVVDIANALLDEIGLREAGETVEWRLGSAYSASEYTVQYQETDLDFLNRLLEHHGITYFFDQAPDGERVVFADGNHAFVELSQFASIDYVPAEAADVRGVVELARELTPQPAMVVLRDYNWRTPSVALQSQAAADEVTGRGFTNRYGDHYKDPGAGQTLAALRAQELLARRDVYRGRCRIAGLRPGHKFELLEHPVGDLNRSYAVTSIQIEMESGGIADAGGSVDLSFTAIPHDVTYRPPLRTACPKIEGVMHARVDGEAPGTAAPIDEWGRYKVVFPFDLVGQSGGKASRWVRLAQPASGPGFGIHFPLHIGAEVAIAHLDGDPDRPIIMNSPPNTETVTPVNHANATQSAIRTQAGIQLIWDDDC